MISRNIAFILIFQVLFVSKALAFYNRYDTAQCTSLMTYQSLVQISPDYFPVQQNQGVYGTCYAFASHFLLHYLLNSTLNLPKSKALTPSVVDLIIRLKRGNLLNPGDGNPGILLMKVANSGGEICLDTFENGNPKDYHHFFGEHWHLKDAIWNDSPTEFEEWAKSLLPASRIGGEQSEKLNQLIHSFSQRKNMYSSAGEIYYLSACEKKVTLPPFKVIAINHQSKYQKSGSPENAVESALSFQKTMIQMLEKGFPVAVGQDGHTVTLTGIRKACCGSECHFEWQVADSLEGETDDPWYLASEFSTHRQASQILPCSLEQPNSAGLPSCETVLEGTSKRQMIAASDDVKALESYLEEYDVTSQSKAELIGMSLPFGAIEITRKFVEDGSFSANGVLPNGRPLLHEAVKYRNLDLAIFLLEKGADPNRLDPQGLPAIYEAFEEQQLEMINILMKFKATDLRNPTSGEGMLFKSVQEKKHRLLEHLLKLKFDPHVKNDKGQAPLDIAGERAKDILLNSF